jgi:cytochrome oxidase assembly protein ShyY1
MARLVCENIAFLSRFYIDANAVILPRQARDKHRKCLETKTAFSAGVPEGSTIQIDSQPGFTKPAVVWYGTSILQGGVASRVGNAFTNMISRRLERTIFNFGFS